MSLPAIEGGRPVRERPLIFKPYPFPGEVLERIREVLDSGILVSTFGKWVRTFERALGEYLGVAHVVATSSGTTALHVALKSLGVGPGDEVITTPFTFLSTASTILHSNAVPVFADIDRETLNIDPISVENRITDKTKALVVVHLAGLPADMDSLMKIAEEHGLFVVEDVAQALGAEYRGRKVGSIAHVSAFSFYATKNITTGEGGAVATNDEDIARSARLLVSHGETRKYFYEVLGYNYRMTEIQGVLGYYQLLAIEESMAKREKFVKVLTEELAGMDQDLVKLPRVPKEVRHSWHLYQMLLSVEKLRKPRDFIVEALRAEGINSVFVAYPYPLYLTDLFQKQVGHGRGCPWSCYFYGGSVSYRRELCPNAEWASERVVSLLVSPTYTESDAVDVANAIKKVLRYYSR